MHAWTAVHTVAAGVTERQNWNTRHEYITQYWNHVQHIPVNYHTLCKHYHFLQKLLLPILSSGCCLNSKSFTLNQYPRNDKLLLKRNSFGQQINTTIQWRYSKSFNNNSKTHICLLYIPYWIITLRTYSFSSGLILTQLDRVIKYMSKSQTF